MRVPAAPSTSIEANPPFTPPLLPTWNLTADSGTLLWCAVLGCSRARSQSCDIASHPPLCARAVVGLQVGRHIVLVETASGLRRAVTLARAHISSKLDSALPRRGTGPWTPRVAQSTPSASLREQSGGSWKCAPGSPDSSSSASPGCWELPDNTTVSIMTNCTSPSVNV